MLPVQIFAPLFLFSFCAVAQFTVEEAVSRAAEHHPALRAAAEAVEEDLGMARQAGLWPNPELDLGVEALGFKSNHGNDHEWLLGLSQEIPAWGALRFAGQAGMTSALATEKEMEVLRNQLVAQTHDYFYSTLYARKKLELLAVACEDADETARLMKVRVEKGDAPEIAWMRAGAEFGKFRAEKEVAVKDLETQRARLAELCGLSPDTLPECVGEIAPMQNFFPPVSAIQNRLETNARGEARILREEAAELLVEAERRAGRPTVALRAGLRRHDADDANAIDLGVSVGLPLFNRNQGAASAARARRQRLTAEHEAQLREEVREAIRLHGEIDAALAAAEQLRTGVLPQYAAVCSALEKALEIGGITLVDLIHERRNLIETQLQHLEYETQARNAATALNRIIMKTHSPSE